MRSWPSFHGSDSQPTGASGLILWVPLRRKGFSRRSSLEGMSFEIYDSDRTATKLWTIAKYEMQWPERSTSPTSAQVPLACLWFIYLSQLYQVSIVYLAWLPLGRYWVGSRTDYTGLEYHSFCMNELMSDSGRIWHHQPGPIYITMSSWHGPTM